MLLLLMYTFPHGGVTSAASVEAAGDSATASDSDSTDAISLKDAGDVVATVWAAATKA